MSAKPIPGRVVELRARGGYILRTPSGVMCLGNKQALAERPAELVADDVFLNKGKKNKTSKPRPVGKPSKVHKYQIPEDRIRYFVEQHNHNSVSWLRLSKEIECSDTVLRRICTDWCEVNAPDEYNFIKARRQKVVVDEDALLIDYKYGKTIRALAKKYGIAETRVYSILRNKGVAG